MTESAPRLHAFDLDRTLRPGFLMSDAIAYGIEEGFVDPEAINDFVEPTLDDVAYFNGQLKNRPLRQFERLLDRITDEASLVTYDWAKEHFSDHPEAIHAALSLSPDFLVDAYARGLGTVSHSRGTRFVTKEDMFLGDVYVLKKVKAARKLMQLVGAPGLSMAASDHISDVPLLKLAESAAVINPDEALEAQALEHDWQIIWTDEYSDPQNAVA